MLKQFVSIQDVCALLNELVVLDPDCIKAFVFQRVPCNEAVADHPTIQVHQPKGEKPTVGLLGILNGIFGIQEDGMGALCAEVDDNNKLIGFRPIN